MNIAIVSPFNPAFVRNLFERNKDSIPDINRNATSVNILVEAFVEKRHKVFVYTTANTAEKARVLYGENIKVSIISKEFHPRGMSNIRVVKRLKKAMLQDMEDLDVIHAHWTYEYAAAARYFENDLPVFCTIRDWCPFQKILARRISEKYAWWLNGLLFSYVMRSKRIQFIANSRYTYEMAYSNFPDKNYRIIPNPVQRKYIVTQKDKSVKTNTFITICQSPEERRKNIDTLLMAFQNLRNKSPDSKLIIVGYYTEEWRQAHEGMLDAVVLTGLISHDEVYRLLDESAVLVHPSIEETFGNILLEAMARRTVCVGGEHAGAVPEVLGYGERGIICDVQNADSLMRAMQKACDITFSQPLIKKAVQYINDNYADDIVAQMHIDLYQKHIQKRRERKK